MSESLPRKYTSFREALKALRKEKKFSLRQLAEEVGISYTYLSKLENDNTGRENPSQDVVAKLARSFQVPEIELLVLAKQLPSSFFEKKPLVDLLCNVPNLSPSQWRELETLAARGSGGPQAVSKATVRPTGAQGTGEATTYNHRSDALEYTLTIQRLPRDPAARIQGKVLFPGRQRPEFPPGSEVVLLNAETKAVEHTPINKVGNFAVNRVPPGRYILHFFIGEILETCELPLNNE